MLFTLRKKCSYLEFFLSRFSRIWTEYEDVLCLSLYSVQMWEAEDQRNTEYIHFLRSVKFPGVMLYCVKIQFKFPFFFRVLIFSCFVNFVYSTDTSP